MVDTKNIVCEWGPGRREAMPGALELFYHNVDVKINVVRILLKETFLKSVIEIKRVSDRIVGLKLEIQGMILKGKIERRPLTRILVSFHFKSIYSICDFRSF